MAEIDNIMSLPPDEQSKDQKNYAKIITSLGASVTEVDCKGILIVGTFRRTPLDDRTEPDLPDPVAKRLGTRDVCILTGSQLLGLVLAGREDPTLRNTFVQQLMNTRGRLQSAIDWTKFLWSAQKRD